MKFRTFVITKNKLIAAAVCTAAAASLCAAFTLLPNYSSDKLNENILRSGAVNGDAPDIKEKIKRILGVDFESPEKIAENGMGTGNIIPGQGDSKNENDSDAANSEDEYGGSFEASEPKDESNTDESSNEISFPSKEEINSGAHISMNNATDYDVDAAQLCAQDLPFSLTDDGPQVLVIHTHTTECYDGDQMAGETERTTDETKNVAAVGEVICKTLEKYGIETYHDTTYHDYPTYQGSYTRELTTVTSLLEQYPSIKVVLDVHRDAFIYEDGTKLKVDCESADRPTAKVMLVVGTDSMGLYHPNWRENLKFAAKIQNAAEIMYPGLTRSIDLRQERFNMHMTTGSLLLEVGSNGNTLEEALNAGENIAEAIAAVLAK